MSEWRDALKYKTLGAACHSVIAGLSRDGSRGLMTISLRDDAESTVGAGYRVKTNFSCRTASLFGFRKTQRSESLRERAGPTLTQEIERKSSRIRNQSVSKTN